MSYVLNDDGEIVETDEVFKNGRFIFIEGKMVRVGEGRRAPIHYGKEDLGVSGVLNPVDGKTYDSRSAYEQAVKAKGCVIVGDDHIAPSKPKLKPINWEKAVAETLKTNPLKGK
jgi:hypothetical protein